MSAPLILASILSADFANLGQECQAAIDAGADMIHFDVMDNHYVNNLTFGPAVCKSLKSYGISAPIDVHLMTSPVDGLIKDFAKAGADAITIHPDATDDLSKSLKLIRSLGLKVGLAISPKDSIADYQTYFNAIDQLLIMTVEPGQGGQILLSNMLPKISEAKSLAPKHVNIFADGGINLDTVKTVIQAGADGLVVGSALFGKSDYNRVIHQLKTS